MAGWVGAQCQVNSAKKLKNYPTCDVTTKEPKPKT